MHLRHTWQVKHVREHPSPFEQMKGIVDLKVMVPPLPVPPNAKEGSSRYHFKNLGPDDFEREVYVKYGCANCPAEKVVRIR